MNLVFTSDQMPGYRRERRGNGFCFRLPDGSLLADPLERKRIASLAVPPAYRDVWVCMISNGHLQATGIDARGRKQYRYHPDWHASSADRKFELLPTFAAALPAIRQRVGAELAQSAITRERVIAGVVALLDLTGYRIGSRKYERENRTFGLSSLLSRHVSTSSDRFFVRFRGKSGLDHRAEIRSPQISRLISQLQELPGQHLFRYENPPGEWHDIATHDINDWLKQIGGGEFSAKQFRTWKATVICARELARAPREETAKGRRIAIRNAIKTTASQLRHTATVCRKYYIHPAVTNGYESGALAEIMEGPAPAPGGEAHIPRLLADERRVFALLTRPSSG